MWGMWGLETGRRGRRHCRRASAARRRRGRRRLQWRRPLRPLRHVLQRPEALVLVRASQPRRRTLAGQGAKVAGPPPELQAHSRRRAQRRGGPTAGAAAGRRCELSSRNARGQRTAAGPWPTSTAQRWRREAAPQRERQQDRAARLQGLVVPGAGVTGARPSRGAASPTASAAARLRRAPHDGGGGAPPPHSARRQRQLTGPTPMPSPGERRPSPRAPPRPQGLQGTAGGSGGEGRAPGADAGATRRWGNEALGQRGRPPCALFLAAKHRPPQE